MGHTQRERLCKSCAELRGLRELRVPRVELRITRESKIAREQV